MLLPARSILVMGLFAAASVALANPLTFTTIDDHLATAGPSGADPAYGTYLSGINDSGQIVGYYTDSNGNHGFVDNGGIFTIIADPLGGDTTPLGINNSGQIVGQFMSSSSSGLSGSVAFLDNGGTFTTITQFEYSCYFGPPASYFCSEPISANAINDSGQIVGYYDSYLNGGQYAYVYTGGTFGIVTGSQEDGDAVATGINDAGQIVGYSVEQTVAALQGFIDNGGTLTYINDSSSSPAARGGVSGTIVTGINDAGQIVGYYDDSAGNVDGFLATPSASPEPSTLPMAFAPVLGSTGYRLRKRLLRS